MNKDIQDGLPRRSSETNIKLIAKGIGGNLALASLITLSLMGGMVLVLVLAMVLILGSENPGTGLTISIVITLIFNLAAFFISPWFMDFVQRWLYKTRWVSLADIADRSPETAKVIRQICTDQKIKHPRLGVINDQNPTAFTYGSLPNSARLVVSEGLFTYLDDEEIATVYAHELGHIVHWDFAVMTIASSLIQICYLIYIFARRISQRVNSKSKDALQTAALAAYIFYHIGSYLLLYLSRVREYFADRFAAEATGNPNALSRALVKIAYGIVEETTKAEEPSRLLEGTRALGIYDAKAATTTGTAYRIASSPEKIGRVFLWDLFNPWGWWMELSSTHPLTGKRVRALSTYAEQLGLAIEFDMGKVVGEGRKLNKKRLYGNFVTDIMLYCAESIGWFIGLIVGIILAASLPEFNPLVAIAWASVGFGSGVVFKGAVMYPAYKKAPQTDILELMSDPYASPLRGKPARINGEIIGRGQAGYRFGSDLKIKDKTGMLYLHYSSRFGPIGNFLFGMARVKNLIGVGVAGHGWFRRGKMPLMDLVQLQTAEGTFVNSYHRFWTFMFGFGMILLGLFLGMT